MIFIIYFAVSSRWVGCRAGALKNSIFAVSWFFNPSSLKLLSLILVPAGFCQILVVLSKTNAFFFFWLSFIVCSFFKYLTALWTLSTADKSGLECWKPGLNQFRRRVRNPKTPAYLWWFSIINKRGFTRIMSRPIPLFWNILGLYRYQKIACSWYFLPNVAMMSSFISNLRYSKGKGLDCSSRH